MKVLFLIIHNNNNNKNHTSRFKILQNLSVLLHVCVLFGLSHRTVRTTKSSIRHIFRNFVSENTKTNRNLDSDNSSHINCICIQILYPQISIRCSAENCQPPLTRLCILKKSIILQTTTISQPLTSKLQFSSLESSLVVLKQLFSRFLKYSKIYHHHHRH